MSVILGEFLNPLFFPPAGTSMAVIRTLSKVAKQALLSTPGCGCQPLTVAVRNISFSPRQVTSDASFHSVSFSETDHPKVLITGTQHVFLWWFYETFIVYERAQGLFRNRSDSIF